MPFLNHCVVTDTLSDLEGYGKVGTPFFRNESPLALKLGKNPLCPYSNSFSQKDLAITIDCFMAEQPILRSLSR